MTTGLLQRFEKSIVAWNPLLAKKLQPGLPEERILRSLRKYRVVGDLGEVITLYRWRNGTRLDPELVGAKAGIFPGKPYYFLDLEMALGHLDHTRVATRKRPQLADGAFYFPLFWDGSTGWIGTDVRPSHGGRVIVADHRAEAPFREVYACLDDFMNDVMRAIGANEELRLV